MTKQLKGIGAAAACAVIWGACGGGTSSPGASINNEVGSEGGEAPSASHPVHRTGSGEVDAEIGPAGGTLELSGGPRVEVPAGAVSEAQVFVLKEAQMTTAFHNEEAERAVGPTFTFAPALAAPEGQSVRVSIPLASYPEGWGDVAISYEYPVSNRVGAEDSQHTKWQYESASLSGGRAVAELPGLNGYRLQFVLSNLEVQ